MFSTPKVEELQSCKMRPKQPLLGATSTQKFMLICCTVVEKLRQNSLCIKCMDGDLYQTCTF